MNILLKNHRFAGGSARSLLEYAKILQSHGNVIISAGEYVQNDVGDLYIKNSIEIVDIQKFLIRKVYQNFSNMLKLNRVIQEKDINLIITVSGMNAVISSIIGKINGIPVIIIIAGGESIGNDRLLSFWNSNDVICFSHENKANLIAASYNPNLIHLLSNRIKVREDNNWLEHYKGLIRHNNKLILFVASRLDKDKIQSINTILNFVEYLSEYEGNFELRIAGDGVMYDFVRQKTSYINNMVGKEIVKILGHVNNLEEEFENAHVLFGKGRSVLEPIMKNRIGVIVSEDNKFCICRTESFDNLYYYNFSGRNISHESSFDELKTIIFSLREGNINFNDIKSNASKVKNYYDISKLDTIFMNLIFNNLTKEKIRSRTSFFFDFCNLLYKFLIMYFIVLIEVILVKRGRSKSE